MSFVRLTGLLHRNPPPPPPPHPQCACRGVGGWWRDDCARVGRDAPAAWGGVVCWVGFGGGVGGGVAVYEIGEKDCAVLIGNISDSVRAVDISTPSSFTLKGSLSDDDALALDRPYAVEVYTIGSKH